MEKACNYQDLDFPAVFDVIGEPAIVINGVPDVTPGTTTILDATSILESNDDPYFGDWLEGRKIQKLFGDQYYSGKVEKYDSETKWYRVVYEDGDFEDLEWHELEEVLLPLDISIPFTILASHRCMSEKSVSKSRIKLVKGRQNNANSLRSKEKTSELLQISQVGEPRDGQLIESNFSRTLQISQVGDPRDGKLMEANFTGRTPQGTLQMQNGSQPKTKETYQVHKHDESLSMPGEYTTSANTCNGQESDSTPVFEVIGEPAIVINGVPDGTPGCAPTILDRMDNPEPGDGPCFGKFLEGRKVHKLFGDRYYLGKVENYDKETNWYRVVYEDGDFEDLEWHELEDLLVPLEISIPLMTLALHMCQSENYVSEPRIKPAQGRKKRKDSLGSLGSMEKATELLHISQMGEARDEKPVEANGIEKTHQGNLQMQKGAQNIEPSLQVCRHDKAVSNLGEGITTSNNNQNGTGKVLNMFQTPERADINGDELVQADAHSEASVGESLKWQRDFQKQRGKTARAEKQRRREKSFAQNSA